jgi:WD40 repeat-containing protein SMU1
LVTGSSDGFVEVWGEPISLNKGDAAASDNTILPTTEIDFEKLRTSDLAYQRNDDLMMHDTPILAMNVSHDGTLLGTTSSDGTVSIWKLSEGKLLRKIERAHGGSGGVSDKGELSVVGHNLWSMT